MSDKLCLPQREKFWNERNNEEKLDALRDQVQHLTYQLGQVCGMVETLLHHSHADGKIVAPIEHRQRHADGKIVAPIEHRQRHESYIPNSLRVNHDK